MNAYDLSTLVLDNKISLVIGSFNIMSNIASRYALPDKDGYVRGPNSGESPNDWKKRYQLLIEMLTKKYFDILCLQEVVPEFYSLLSKGSFSGSNSFFRNYYIYFESSNGLMTMINKMLVLNEPERFETVSTKYSKTLGYTIDLVNNININIVNVHLVGDPAKENERIEILQGVADRDTIVVGDFNESVDDLYNNSSFDDFLSKNHLQLTNAAGNCQVKTSYSRYIVNNFGYVERVKDDSQAWESVDDIIFDMTRFFIIDRQLFPAKGLEGKEVPYLHLGNHFTRNFVMCGWTSDHTLQLYTFLV